MVDVVLGLYAMVVRERDFSQQANKSGGAESPSVSSGRSSMRRAPSATSLVVDVERLSSPIEKLDALIQAHFGRVFPSKFFGDLPILMESLMKTDGELMQRVHSSTEGVRLASAELRRRPSLPTDLHVGGSMKFVAQSPTALAASASKRWQGLLPSSTAAQVPAAVEEEATPAAVEEAAAQAPAAVEVAAAPVSDAV